MLLDFIPISISHETSQVSFFDAGVDASYVADIVIHPKNEISPPDDGSYE